MTSSNFDRALKLVLVHEGGYVNHPKDPGGATNKGVTQATYNAYRKAKGLSAQSVKAITTAEVGDIYRTRYWQAVKGDELPSGVDYAVFDFGVNSGPSRAIKFLQRIVGADDDGAFGPKTMAAVLRQDSVSIIKALLDERLSWLKGLPTWKTFGKGWNNRIIGVRKDALAMVRQPLPQVGPTPPHDWAIPPRNSSIVPPPPPGWQPDQPTPEPPPIPPRAGFLTRLLRFLGWIT